MDISWEMGKEIMRAAMNILGQVAKCLSKNQPSTRNKTIIPAFAAMVINLILHKSFSIGFSRCVHKTKEQNALNLNESCASLSKSKIKTRTLSAGLFCNFASLIVRIENGWFKFLPGYDLRYSFTPVN